MPQASYRHTTATTPSTHAEQLFPYQKSCRDSQHFHRQCDPSFGGSQQSFSHKWKRGTLKHCWIKSTFVGDHQHAVQEMGHPISLLGYELLYSMNDIIQINYLLVNLEIISSNHFEYTVCHQIQRTGCSHLVWLRKYRTACLNKHWSSRKYSGCEIAS